MGVDDAPIGSPFSGTVGLYSFCCLELFNHIAENAAYQRCANETCGRLFVRQRGRSVPRAAPNARREVLLGGVRASACPAPVPQANLGLASSS